MLGKSLKAMINKAEFYLQVQNLTTIKSVTGKATYTNFALQGDILYFTRIEKATDWNLNLQDLFKVYHENNIINTTILKNALGRRTNSPSFAILIAINACDTHGNRK